MLRICTGKHRIMTHHVATLLLILLFVAEFVLVADALVEFIAEGGALFEHGAGWLLEGVDLFSMVVSLDCRSQRH